MQIMPVDILLWGTGKIAERIVNNNINARIIGCVETKKNKDYFQNYPVYDADNIPDAYEFIIVASHFSDEIFDVCIDKELPLQKVIFMVPGKRAPYNDNVLAIKRILGDKNFTNYQIAYGKFEATFVFEDAKQYQKLNQRRNFAIQEKYMWPIIKEKYVNAGNVTNYFFQDLWAAKYVIGSKVKRHYDIGSRIDGFITHLLAAGIEVNMIDVRPFPYEVEGLYTTEDDATMLTHVQDGSLKSLSALCSLEHFGLGRYGDPVDPEACFKCFKQIVKKLAVHGKLYLSLPVGKERVEFNAHRVFYASTIVEELKGLELQEFSCTAQGKIEYNVDIHKYDDDNNNGEYRYGLFLFEKVSDK